MRTADATAGAACRSASSAAVVRTPTADGATHPAGDLTPTHWTEFRADPAGGQEAARRRRVAAGSTGLDDAELAAWTVVAQHDPEPGRDDLRKEVDADCNPARWTGHATESDPPPLLRPRPPPSARPALASPAGAGRRPRARERQAALRARRRSASSTCSSPAARRTWSCSTTSRRWRSCTARELPDSIRQGQRLTGMTSGQKSFPVIAPKFKFAQHGKAGAWLSELLPHTARIVDDLCIIRSMHTEAINHDPAITFIQTGSQQPGRPSFGVVAQLRPGQRGREPAGVRRHDLARHRQRRQPGAARSPVGQRLPAVEPSGGEAPQRPRPGPVPVRPAGHRLAIVAPPRQIVAPQDLPL